MVVRPATPLDAEAFSAVVGAVADEGRWILTEPPIDLTDFADRTRLTVVSGRDRLWVLEDGGELVGTLGLHRTEADGVVTLGMAVLASHRGLGGGRQLIDEALADARDGSLHKVELEVFDDNARAIGLYSSVGFAVEGVRHRHHRRRDGTLKTSLLMALRLDD